MRSKHKKADLSLSINAIVILILAITMLGLGLTFMRGLFKQMESKISEAVSAQELTNPPTTDNVMTVAPGDMTIRQKEVGTAVVAFLNTNSPTDTCKLTGANTGGSAVATVTVSAQIVVMVQDQINMWTASIVPTTTLGTGLYTFTMTCTTSGKSYTKDLVITVIS